VPVDEPGPRVPGERALTGRMVLTRRSVGVLLLVAVTTCQERYLSTRWQVPLYVAIYPIAADDSPVTRAYLAALDAERFQPIDRFFMREAARYRLDASGDRVQVEFPRLKVLGRWEADGVAPVEHTVFENATGSVVWNCLQPRSTAWVRIGERKQRGLGYAERLTVTLPPWQLPMRQLRWGRFVSPEDAVAWIDWQGPYSTSFATHNGRQNMLLSVTETEVELSDGVLRMEPGLALRAGRVGSTVLPGARALGRLLPRSLFNIEEQKWRSRGSLQAGERESRGWVIHEVVHWKV